MELYYLKAFHIIFVVTWMAGIFFLGRMLIYFKQAEERDEIAQQAVQDVVSQGAKRVWYIIILPSMIGFIPKLDSLSDLSTRETLLASQISTLIVLASGVVIFPN